jgi:hypothetical protein
VDKFDYTKICIYTFDEPEFINALTFKSLYKYFYLVLIQEYSLHPHDTTQLLPIYKPTWRDIP